MAGGQYVTTGAHMEHAFLSPNCLQPKNQQNIQIIQSFKLLRLHPLPESGPPDTNWSAYLEIYNASKKVA